MGYEKTRTRAEGVRVMDPAPLMGVELPDTSERRRHSQPIAESGAANSVHLNADMGSKPMTAVPGDV